MNVASAICRLAVALPVICLAAASPTTSAQDPEPPQSFQLVVDGKPFDITAGEEIEIEASGKARVKLIVSPTRAFGYGGLSFLYPGNFSWECEHNDGSMQWLLDGNDVVLMILGFDEIELAADEFAQSIGQAYEESSVNPCSASIGGSTMRGSELRATVANQEISQQVYAIPTEGGSRLIVIQDSLQDDGQHTAEYQNVLELLDKSFRASSSQLK